ncbi:heavy metal translocating P-type ATPase [Pediococcus acidilactici]
MIKIQQWFAKNGNWLTGMAAALTVMGWLLQHGKFSLEWGMIAYSLATLAAGMPILLKAISAVHARIISIELLVSIAVVGALAIGEFEEAAMVTLLFGLGNYLEQRTLKKTHQALTNLTEMQPTQAILVEAGQTRAIAVDDVAAGDHLLVRIDDQIPVDGRVVSGTATVNEAVITGEARLVNKVPTDLVYMGTVVENGSIVVEAQKVGEATTFGKIIELVEEAQDNQAPVSRFIDRFARFYTPIVLVLAILTGLVTQNFRLAITILVLACPGALVIGTPVSNVAGIGRGAQSGILIKGGQVIDQLAKVNTILMDKTGTVTTGKPSVQSFYPYTQQDWLMVAAQLESQTNHPLAAAVVEFYEQRAAQSVQNQDVQISTIKGIGIAATWHGHQVKLGSPRILELGSQPLSKKQATDLQKLQEARQSIILMTVDGLLVLAIGLSDQIRPGVASALKQLRQAGVTDQWMVTGDQQMVAESVAKAVGVTQVKAGKLPNEKAQFLNELQANGQPVLFVGDGINDSPAIAQAAVGIAMGSGTDVAIETSDVVLINPDFKNIVFARQLAQATVRNMTENVGIAVGTVALLMLGVSLGWVNMASGMFFHEVSILVVIFNAMRLLKLRRPTWKNFSTKTSGESPSSETI